jgi:hypothetical protein
MSNAMNAPPCHRFSQQHARSKEPGALPLVITHGWLSRHLGGLDAPHVVGVHVNLMIGFPPGKPDDQADVSELEQALLARPADYMAKGNGDVAVQSTRPLTLAYGLEDSPTGLLAWIADKFWAWTDHDSDF